MTNLEKVVNAVKENFKDEPWYEDLMSNLTVGDMEDYFDEELLEEIENMTDETFKDVVYDAIETIENDDNVLDEIREWERDNSEEAREELAYWDWVDSCIDEMRGK